MAQAKTPKGEPKKSVKSPRARAAKSNGTGADVESEIRVRAYELYAERGFTAGHQDEDWLVAEREVKAKHATAGA